MILNSEAQQMIRARIDEYAKQRIDAAGAVERAQQQMIQAQRQVDALDGAIQALRELLKDTPNYAPPSDNPQ